MSSGFSVVEMCIGCYERSEGNTETNLGWSLPGKGSALFVSLLFLWLVVFIGLFKNSKKKNPNNTWKYRLGSKTHFRSLHCKIITIDILVGILLGIYVCVWCVCGVWVCVFIDIILYKCGHIPIVNQYFYLFFIQ